MKLGQGLKSATFIQRKSANIIEADIGTTKINILCPNNSILNNCTVLGSKIWYTPEISLPYYIPATWQLAEVDCGEIVLVNNNLCKELFLEAHKFKIIELVKNSLISQEVSLPGGFTYDFKIYTESEKLTTYQKDCFICVAGSTYSTNNCNYFPEESYYNGCDELYSLIHAKILGHRAILCCFILNDGVNKLCITNKHNNEYAILLAKALELGVEFMAFGTKLAGDNICLVKDTVIEKEIEHKNLFL